MRKCWEGEKKKWQNDSDDASLRVVGFYSFLNPSFALKNALLAQKIWKIKVS